MRKTHYVYGSGDPGCLYDNQGTADTLEEAIESALFPFGLTGDTDAENEAIDAALKSAREELASDGIYYFPSELRAVFGASYVEVSEEYGENPAHYEAFREDWDHLQKHDSAGMSFGVRRCALVETDPQPNRFAVFAFGAYASTYVAVGYEENPYHAADICDLLESAAEWLATHAPGHLTQPDYEEAREDASEDARNAFSVEHYGASYYNVTPQQRGKVIAQRDLWALPIDDERVIEHAESDLTYTESGYLISHEWTIVGEAMERDDLLAWVRNGD